MRSFVKHHLEHDDTIVARLEGPGIEARPAAAILLGGVVIYATPGQCAALRDALDRMLSGDAPGGPPVGWEEGYGMPAAREGPARH